MKKFLFLFVASSLALSACGNQETEKHTEKKNVQTKKEKQDNRQPEDNKKIPIENVANNENVALRNNSISNVMEGPPEAAYQSSLNIEKGTEVPPSYHMYDNYGNTLVKQKTLDNNKTQTTLETQKQSAATNNPQH